MIHRATRQHERARRPGAARAAAGLFAALAAACAVTLGSGGGGCAPAIVVTAGLSMAQAGTSAFIRGELLSARQASLDQVWLATLGALDELAFDVQVVRTPDDPESEGRSAYVMAQDDDGPEVKVKLERASDAVTRVRIRIDLRGDLSLWRLVLSKIDERLPHGPPGPVPY